MYTSTYIYISNECAHFIIPIRPLTHFYLFNSVNTVCDVVPGAAPLHLNGFVCGFCCLTAISQPGYDCDESCTEEKLMSEINWTAVIDANLFCHHDSI